MEKAREYQKKLYICFIDYSKAFDCVQHDKFWSALKELGASAHLIKLIKELYTDQEAVVRTRFGDTEWFKIKKGTRQGCILSPLLYNLYAEAVMRRAALDEANVGVRIGGRKISNLRYAGDTTLLAESEKDLSELIRKIKTESAKMGLTMDVKKTKMMATEEKRVCIEIEGEKVEMVDSYIFLGSLIVSNGVLAPEIQRRIALGRTAMVDMNRVWRCRNVEITTKRRLVTFIVFPIMAYGCESWVLTKSDRRRVETFEKWCWRRLLQIPWTAKISNVNVIDHIQPKLSLVDKITKHNLSYFDHVMRANSLEKEMMLGMVEGNGRRGRPRTRWRWYFCGILRAS